MQKIREVAGNVVQSARLFNLTLVFALSGALPVTANLDLYFDTPPAYGRRNVRAAYRPAALAPLNPAYGSAVSHYVCDFAPRVKGNAHCVDALRLAAFEFDIVNYAAGKSIGGVIAICAALRLFQPLHRIGFLVGWFPWLAFPRWRLAHQGIQLVPIHKVIHSVKVF